MCMNIYNLSVQYSAESNKFVVQKISESATSFLTLPKIIFLRVFRSEKKHKTLHFSLQSKKGGKDQESIQSSTTSDPGYHMGK